jgi:chitinase
MNKPFRHLITGVCALGASVAAQAAGVYAPYVDMTAWPTPMIDQIGVEQGIQQFTLAFVIGEAINACRHGAVCRTSARATTATC